MTIQTTDAIGLYTKELVAVYKDSMPAPGFLRSFFKPVETDTLEVSIMVRRGKEKIAVDVARGSDGNRNKFSNAQEKIFIPPYYREYWDFTSLDLYDRLMDSTEISSSMFNRLMDNGMEKTAELVEKINRTYEVQCSQVFQTGIVTFDQGPVGQINFGRRAASLVNNASYYFAANNDFTIPFKAAGDFLRIFGKYNGGTFNAIFGDQAWTNFLLNTTFLSRVNLFNMSLDGVREPQRNSQGGVLQGYITAGSYKINCWTYPQFYDDANDVATSYIDTKKVIVVPDASSEFLMSYAEVPQLWQPGQPKKKGAFIFQDYIDEKKKTHEFHVESAGVPIPVALDKIYTFQAVA